MESQHNQPPDSGILGSVGDQRILDPLSEVTRKERTSLLGASLIAFALSQGGLIPKQIDAFGISISDAEKVSLLALTALVLLYYVLAFMIYSVSDLKARDLVIQRGNQSIDPGMLTELRTLSSTSIDFENPQALEKFGRLADETRLAASVKKVGGIRVLFDAHLPIVTGISALAFVIAEIQGYRGSLRAAFILGAAAFLTAAYYVWTLRKEIPRWFAKGRRKLGKYRISRLQKKLPKASPAHREKLMKKIMDLMTKSLRGPW